MEGDVSICVCSIGKFISIHSLRMEGDDSAFADNRYIYIISIHSLRMEGDVAELVKKADFSISIHSLRMEGDGTKPN